MVGASGFEPPTCRRGDRSTPYSLASLGPIIQHGIEFLTATARLEVPFSPYGFRARQEGFGTNECPGDPVTSGLRLTGIVSAESGIQVAGRTGIQSARDGASEDIYMEHVGPSMGKG